MSRVTNIPYRIPDKPGMYIDRRVSPTTYRCADGVHYYTSYAEPGVVSKARGNWSLTGTARKALDGCAGVYVTSCRAAFPASLWAWCRKCRLNRS